METVKEGTFAGSNFEDAFVEESKGFWLRLLDTLNF
jgi:hypothetical protein